MIQKAQIATALRALAAAAGIQFAVCGSAGAFVIATTGDLSAGNPAGQPIYEVSGLVAGDSFTLNWTGFAGLGASGTVSVQSLSATSATIQVMLANNSTPIGTSGDPRFTAFGLSVEDFTGLGSTATGGTLLDLADSSNFPGFAQVVACATSGTNCAGGGSGGIGVGQTDTFSLVLNGTFGTSLTLNDFALKVQGGPNGDSFELAGIPEEPPQSDIAEPSGLAAIGLAITLIGLARARRNRRRL